MGVRRISKTRLRRFLAYLREGCTVIAAAAEAQVGRSSVYYWRGQDPEFRAAWDDTVEIGDQVRFAIYDDEIDRAARFGLPADVFWRGEKVATTMRHSASLKRYAHQVMGARRAIAAASRAANDDDSNDDKGPAPPVRTAAGPVRPEIAVRKFFPGGVRDIPTPEQAAAGQEPGRIVLPHRWAPRPHQEELWKALETGTRRAVAVWHRRAGKDSVAMNFAAVAARNRVGNYWHLFPTASQGRKALWEGIDASGVRFIDQAFPRGYRIASHEDDMLLRLDGGSTWQIVGSDNFDRLVGANPAGVVFSEWALADPRAWDYIRPILAENNGWAMFVYTARGRNHGATMFEMARTNADWFADLRTIEQTGIISPETIAAERNSGMSDEMIRQEYYCSFQAALQGAYFGRALEEAENAGRIGAVPHIPGLPVITAWDLGIGDSTAIWFAQQAGREIRLIDYYESSGVGLDHYAKVLADRSSQGGYCYGETLLPHDANVSELGTGRTRLETLRGLGIGGQARIVRRLGLDDGINAGRVILPRCSFDAARCARGIEALRQYRRAWSEERKAFAGRPLHDWSSHAADAFRYLAVGLRDALPFRPAPEDLPTVAGDGPPPGRGGMIRCYDGKLRPAQAETE